MQGGAVVATMLWNNVGVHFAGNVVCALRFAGGDGRGNARRSLYACPGSVTLGVGAGGDEERGARRVGLHFGRKERSIECCPLFVLSGPTGLGRSLTSCIQLSWQSSHSLRLVARAGGATTPTPSRDSPITAMIGAPVGSHMVSTGNAEARAARPLFVSALPSPQNRGHKPSLHAFVAS